MPTAQAAPSVKTAPVLPAPASGLSAAQSIASATKPIKLQATANLSSKKPELAKAVIIYIYSCASAQSLINAFADAKAKRGGRRGVLTDQEQDILRAALVMSCAGIDASIKQATRDCFEKLFQRNEKGYELFQRFIQKRLAGDGDSGISSTGNKFLALILAETNPRQKLIVEYIRELTSDSLLSFEQLKKTSAELGIDKGLILEEVKLRKIFVVRNTIIHELDIDLNARARKRGVRS